MTDWKELCKGCGECCGCVPFNPELFSKIKGKTQRKYTLMPFIANTVVPITDDFICVFLTKEKLCSIYEDRPEVCRIQGTIERLPCPRIHSKEIMENKAHEVDDFIQNWLKK
jgi:Fe-S-cluster containining protein